MTPLKPIESLRVKGVASTRYPLNQTCAQPECTEPAVDAHHCWPRSQIIGDSWFVQITLSELGDSTEGFPVTEEGHYIAPHVTGLCRQHHEDVELHRAWIKLEDGEFRWYDRDEDAGYVGSDQRLTSWWVLLGPLNPQPGSREGKPKKKKHLGEAKRKTAVWSIRCPKDADEDGIEALKVLVEEARKKIGRPEGTPPYFTLMEALYAFVTSPPDPEESAA